MPLNRAALAVLERQRGKHAERGFTYNGQPVLKANNHAWRKALRRAGITDFRWHDLRHIWATWHVQGGTPLGVLQELGGWASYEMVRRYAHFSADHLAAYVENVPTLTPATDKPRALRGRSTNHVTARREARDRGVRTVTICLQAHRVIVWVNLPDFRAEGACK